MWEKVPREYKRRFAIIIYIYLPICLVIGLLLGIKILRFISANFDLKGTLFVSFCIVPLYILGVFSVYRTLQKKKPKAR